MPIILYPSGGWESLELEFETSLAKIAKLYLEGGERKLLSQCPVFRWSGEVTFEQRSEKWDSMNEFGMKNGPGGRAGGYIQVLE
jgi:hypothetical protein